MILRYDMNDTVIYTHMCMNAGFLRHSFTVSRGDIFGLMPSIIYKLRLDLHGASQGLTARLTQGKRSGRLGEGCVEAAELT